MKICKNYINGEWVESVSGKTAPTYNPANGEILAEVVQSNLEDVERAVAAAKKYISRTLYLVFSSGNEERLHGKICRRCSSKKSGIGFAHFLIKSRYCFFIKTKSAVFLRHLKGVKTHFAYLSVYFSRPLAAYIVGFALLFNFLFAKLSYCREQVFAFIVKNIHIRASNTKILV